VLIRSGLIQSVDRTDVQAFSRHWLGIHGPLAKKLPNLRGYVQNHIVARADTPPSPLHRIDGISQLWFDNVDAMKAGMDSPENQACIKDISGFLARVTLAIQAPGRWIGSAVSSASPAKVMAVYAGEESDRARVEKDIAAAFRNYGVPTTYRVNQIVSGEFIVDRSVARSELPLLAVLETYFTDENARSKFLAARPLVVAGNYAPAAVLAVTPHVMIPPPV
jgi:uncharacterized protein (TIGR02118 family)